MSYVSPCLRPDSLCSTPPVLSSVGKKLCRPGNPTLKHRVSTTNAEPPVAYCNLGRDLPGRIFQDNWPADVEPSFESSRVLAEVVAQGVGRELFLRYGRVETALKLGDKEFHQLSKALAASMKRGLNFVAKGDGWCDLRVYAPWLHAIRVRHLQTPSYAPLPA